MVGVDVRTLVGLAILAASLLLLAQWGLRPDFEHAPLPSIAAILGLAWLVHRLLPRRLFGSLRDKSPAEFEEWVAGRFRRRGFRVTRVGGAYDGGVDLVLERLGSREVVQCKRYAAPIGPDKVRELIGAMKLRKARKGHLVTTSRFTEAARSAAKGHRIELWDEKRLDNL